MTHIQAMEAMGKLQEINGMVRLLIGKLPGIRAELFINVDNWQEWNFEGFLENLRKWTEGNPMVSRDEQISFQLRKKDYCK